MIGSTEWVEDNAKWLTETAVTYLNIDVGVIGANVALGATPELHHIGSEIFKKVIKPNEGAFNESLYDSWVRNSGGDIEVLGSGSDFTAFVHYGIASVSVIHKRRKEKKKEGKKDK